MSKEETRDDLFRILVTSVAILTLTVDSVRAQLGGTFQGPNKEATGKSNRQTGQVECGPAGCRPILPAVGRYVGVVRGLMQTD
jgi:hypothetical protein